MIKGISSLYTLTNRNFSIFSTYLQSTFQKHQFTIKNTSMDQIKYYLPRWADMQGWDFGLNDAQNLYQANPEGFFFGYLDKEPIGHINAVKLGNDYGVMGLLVLKPEYRKRGYGQRLFDHAFQYLGNTNICLNSVIDQIPNYQKKGFKPYDNYSSMYYARGIKQHRQDERIVPLTSIQIKEIRQYQNSCGFNYPLNFTKKWISQPGCSLGFVQKEKLKGFGVMRPTKKLNRIGPLFADSPEIASNLFQAFRKYVGPDSTICLTVDDKNRSSVQMMENFNCEKVFVCRKMFLHKEPTHIDVDKWYGLYDYAIS